MQAIFHLMSGYDWYSWTWCIKSSFHGYSAISSPTHQRNTCRYNQLIKGTVYFISSGGFNFRNTSVGVLLLFVYVILGFSLTKTPLFISQKCCQMGMVLLKTFPPLISGGQNLILMYVTNSRGANTLGLFPPSSALFWAFLHLLLSSGSCSRCSEMEPAWRQTLSSCWTSPSWTQSSWPSSHLEFWITWSGSVGQ